jgi:hypothetical protein
MDYLFCFCLVHRQKTALEAAVHDIEILQNAARSHTVHLRKLREELSGAERSHEKQVDELNAIMRRLRESLEDCNDSARRAGRHGGGGDDEEDGDVIVDDYADRGSASGGRPPRRNNSVQRATFFQARSTGSPGTSQSHLGLWTRR